MDEFQKQILAELRSLREEMRSETEGLRDDMGSGFVGVNEKIDRVGETLREIKSDIKATRDIMGEFYTPNPRMDALEHDVFHLKTDVAELIRVTKRK